MTVFINTDNTEVAVWNDVKHVPDVGDSVLVFTPIGMNEFTVVQRVWFMQDTMREYQKEQCVTLKVE